MHIASKVPALKGWDAQKGGRITLKDHLERFPDLYRGYSTFLRVDQKTGRMVLKDSFQVELPPYTQDLADAGKGPSYGFAFINSYNVEMPAARRRGSRRLKSARHSSISAICTSSTGRRRKNSSRPGSSPS